MVLCVTCGSEAAGRQLSSPFLVERTGQVLLWMGIRKCKGWYRLPAKEYKGMECLL